MFGYIYLVRNKVNGKQYVGQKHSETFCPDYFGSGVYLKRALRKYGVSNFEHVKVLEWCATKEELDRAEMYWIDYFHAVESPDFYNLAKGGVGTTAGSKRSDSWISKIAIASHERVWTDESKEKARQSSSGRIWVNNSVEEKHPLAEDVKEWLDKGYVLGRLPLSKEVRSRMSESHKGKKILGGNPSRRGKPSSFSGKTHSDEQKEIWKVMRRQMVWVNRDGINTVIHSNQIDEYLSDGWQRGMIRKAPANNKGKVRLSKDGGYKYVSPSEVDFYLEDGWTR